jgi:hypothetical protein
MFFPLSPSAPEWFERQPGAVGPWPWLVPMLVGRPRNTQLQRKASPISQIGKTRNQETPLFRPHNGAEHAITHNRQARLGLKFRLRNPRITARKIWSCNAEVWDEARHDDQAGRVDRPSANSWSPVGSLVRKKNCETSSGSLGHSDSGRTPTTKSAHMCI